MESLFKLQILSPSVRDGFIKSGVGSRNILCKHLASGTDRNGALSSTD